MGLRDLGETLPPGFRFYPSDEELVCHYLYRKIAQVEVLKDTLVEIDLHTCEPWQLPDVAKLNSNEWYFFSFRDRKYSRGYRTNRATTSGYWKATGKDRVVLDPRTRAIVGMRKTLVFYKNRAPIGIKTGWIMHEFRLEDPQFPPNEDWVLCRVFHKTRGENSNNFNTQNIYQPTACATSPIFATSSTTNEHALPSGGYQNLATSFSNSTPHQSLNPIDFLNVSALDQYNQFELPHDTNNMQVPSNKIPQTKWDEEYGFLFHMSSKGSTMNDDALHSSLEDIPFDDDNSLIFI